VQTSTPPQKEAQTQPREEHETKKNTNRELTSQLKEAKDGENSSSEKTCAVCHKGCGDAHTCMVCGLPTHAICGHSGEEEEGYGKRITCTNCKEKRHNEKEERVQTSTPPQKEAASMSDEESDSTLELHVDGAFLMDQRVFSCFDASCPPLDKLSGLLRHVRECHTPSEVPSWFIRKWELKACSLCQFYFKDLSRHSKCSGRPPSHSAHAHNPPDGASVGYAAVGGQGSASEWVSASEQTDVSTEEVPLSGDDTPESEGLPTYPPEGQYIPYS
jgi:hypothetical protein